MAINFKKYIDAKSTHFIANSGSDERKKYTGGEAGDQTGHEWELKKWYSRPWTVVLRYPDYAVALKIAELGITAALNNKIGYDQKERGTYWKQLKKVNYDPSKITVPCEEDCTAGVSSNVRAAGYIFDIKALQDIPLCTSRNMRSQFTKAGFVALTDKKYLTGYSYLLPGDILLCEDHHAATNITIGKNAKVPEVVSAPVEPAVPEVPEFELGPDVVGYINVRHGNYFVRTEPNTNGSKLGVVHTGDQVPYLGENQNGWFKVRFNGQEGWLSGKAGDLVETPVVHLEVKKGTWNVRKEPDAKSEKLDVVAAGENLIGTGKEENGWYEIKLGDGTGWVSKKAF